MRDTRRIPRHPDRRTFLAGLGSTLLWPRDLHAFSARLAGSAHHDYWRIVRGAFHIADDRIYLNVGTLGAQPRTVVDAVVEHTRRVAETFPPALDWDGVKHELGRLLSADPAGFIFPRNTTEAMSFVANGLDFSAGDEILTTDHEHIGGLCCWQLAARRHDLVLRVLPIPPIPEAPEQIVDIFRRAVTPRTRVISVSHVNFTNGLIMPVHELVRLGRERGIIIVVDGAHPPGLMRLDLNAMDPDFYASSPHKWLLAPQGTGFLWMREPWRTRLWPSVASGGWDDTSLGAHRFNHMGTLDESRLAGLAAALAFHESIGATRVTERIAQLRARLITGLELIPRLRFASPKDATDAAGMVAFTVDGVPALELQRRLAERPGPSDSPMAGRALRVRTRVISEYDYGWMRLSPHVYNLEDEIDTVTAMIAAIAS
jgi:isopenicillin-N epimerase